ncbi:MAG TPA: hypothetical protein VEV17_25185 [Bryobacteraceae bacterium]|nr:hypothetical protein [Bryobacteraceae bacterium]
MLSKSYCWKAALAIGFAAVAWGGTFGTVVSIGGQASDVALDEPRGLLYIANFTANRVDVMSLANNTIQTSINVPAQPSALAVSPDDHFLVVAHFGNAAPPGSSTNALSVIDLGSNAIQTFALGSPPLGVAFGIDGMALVVTTTDFLLFDPVSGSTIELDTIAGVSAKTLPQPAGSTPTSIVAASVAASADGLTIYGLGDTLVFRYAVTNRALSASLYTAAPPLGPRVVSVSQDGSSFTAGWTLEDRYFFDISEFPNPSGILNVGTTAIDSAHNLIYAQVRAKGDQPSPVLQIVDADNLTVESKLNLPENFAGRSVLSSDGSTLYGVSDSGVMVLTVGSLSAAHQVVATQEDMVFRGNFCDRSVATQVLTVVDPSGGNTAFSITSNTPGLSVSPSSGVTPATILVTVDPNVFASQKGTVVAALQLQSDQAVNIPKAVRVLINSREPVQRGIFVDVPGVLVDMLADPTQNRFYLLRQDLNQVQVYDGTNNTLIATLRTGNVPKGMAIARDAFNRQYLLVGCDSAQYVSVFDLQTLQPTQPIRMQNGDYVQSLAAANNAILAVTRSSAGLDPSIHSIDLGTRSSTRLPSLGVFQNKVALNSVLVASTNGSSILLASTDGSVMLYDANSHSFTASRKDFTSLSGAYAASNFNQYVVGNNVLDSSLVPLGKLEVGTGAPSGFAFVDQFAFRTTAPGPPAGSVQSTAPGIIQRIDPTNLTSNVTRATPMVEAPLLGITGAAFTRTLAPLYSRTAIINLTVSGFTVLPWNYDAALAPPQITSVVNAADLTVPIAPGGLISVFGTQFSSVNLATNAVPLPTQLADTCLSVNGQPVPIRLVSLTQVNGQMPFEAIGDVTMILRTPGGTSNNYNLKVLPGAPAVFYNASAGPDTNLPTVFRGDDGLLVTDSHPVHRKDNADLVIYLTGLGQTNPAVGDGLPSPSNPLAVPLNAPGVTLGGVSLPVVSYNLTPGQVGWYQIEVNVPTSVPTGLSVPLVIAQGQNSTSLAVRVVD